jgi:dihydroorotate dehydrogenase (NAD+) catalytic subunit
MNLSVKIGKVVFPNPVTVASGTFGHAKEFYDLEEVRRLGAIIPKTITYYAREGNPPRRIVETPAGMLNAIGIENAGVDVFINEKLPQLASTGVPLIVSILGHTDTEFVLLAEKLTAAGGIAALELNLSCPNLQKKVLVAQDPKATARLIAKVKKVTPLLVLAKLSPNVTDITTIAQAAVDGGADGLSLINTLTGMVINTKTRRPVLGNVTGGLSGPAIRPVALNMVYQVAKKVKVPLIAMGGIEKADDALQFIIAGATMVAVGTMNFINPRAPLEVLEGIEAYLRAHDIKDIKDLRGSLQVKEARGQR